MPRITVEKAFEDLVPDKVYLVSGSKIKRLKDSKIKFHVRMKSGTSNRVYEFEEMEKEPELEKAKKPKK